METKLFEYYANIFGKPTDEGEWDEFIFWATTTYPKADVDKLYRIMYQE